MDDQSMRAGPHGLGEWLVAERECSRLAVDYACYVDRRQAGELAGLFTEDGTLSTLGRTYHGREEIAGMVANLDPSVTMLHVNANFRIDLDSSCEATGDIAMVAYIFPAADGPSRVKSLSPSAIGSYADRYRKVEGRWYFLERRFVAQAVLDSEA